MNIIRSLLEEVKEYKRASIATPIFMILEVLKETMIPFLMASIIDDRHLTYGWCYAVLYEISGRTERKIFFGTAEKPWRGQWIY